MKASPVTTQQQAQLWRPLTRIQDVKPAHYVEEDHSV